MLMWNYISIFQFISLLIINNMSPLGFHKSDSYFKNHEWSTTLFVSSPMMIKYESTLLKPYENMFISNSEENTEPHHYSAYFVLLHFYHDAKKWKTKQNKTKDSHRNNELNKKEKHFHFKNTSSKRFSMDPPVRPDTLYWPDTGLWKLKTITKPSWNRWSQHTRTCKTSLTSLQLVSWRNREPFRYENQTFKYFYHCTGTRFSYCIY